MIKDEVMEKMLEYFLKLTIPFGNQTPDMQKFSAELSHTWRLQMRISWMPPAQRFYQGIWVCLFKAFLPVR